ncbi:endonuclease V [Candidatus Woesearchaeota archaeon]|nr:endonuclease V [Candidatus Woesearchaeota archaeon]
MIDINKIKEEQVKLAKKVIISDAFDKIETIAGVDQAFIGEDVISGIAVCSYKELMSIEKKYAVARAKIPYIPGFLFYREGPAIIEAFSKLENKPDILIVDGNGILHPRRFGMASHIGILLDTATIGVAKSLIGGEVKEGTIYMEKEARGYELRAREHSKPIYVSPGHKISLKTSMEIVKKCIKFPHKLPEPLHLAHRHANKAKEDLENANAI